MSGIPPVHPAVLDDEALLAQCAVQRTRASGPGGQHRNKVETAIRLTHEPSGLSVLAGERRSQAQNQHVAVRRLRLKLAVQVRGGLEGGPSDLWRSRVVKGRIQVNPSHADFPALLAEAMDVIACKRGDVSAAAAVLGVSGSQLIKLLKLEPAGLERVNEMREARGMHRMK